MAGLLTEKRAIPELFTAFTTNRFGNESRAREIGSAQYYHPAIMAAIIEMSLPTVSVPGRELNEKVLAQYVAKMPRESKDKIIYYSSRIGGHYDGDFNLDVYDTLNGSVFQTEFAHGLLIALTHRMNEADDYNYSAKYTEKIPVETTENQSNGNVNTSLTLTLGRTQTTDEVIQRRWAQYIKSPEDITYSTVAFSVSDINGNPAFRRSYLKPEVTNIRVCEQAQMLGIRLRAPHEYQIFQDQIVD